MMEPAKKAEKNSPQYPYIAHDSIFAKVGNFALQYWFQFL